MKFLTPEFIEAITPLGIAFIGGAFGIIVLSLRLETTITASALGVTSTAIGAGAGLAQPKKNSPQKDDN